jgi:hypothetical protein
MQFFEFFPNKFIQITCEIPGNQMGDVQCSFLTHARRSAPCSRAAGVNYPRAKPRNAPVHVCTPTKFTSPFQNAACAIPPRRKCYKSDTCAGPPSLPAFRRIKPTKRATPNAKNPGQSFLTRFLPTCALGILTKRTQTPRALTAPSSQPYIQPSFEPSSCPNERLH